MNDSGTISYPYRTADPMLYNLLKTYAKENRKNATDAESILWKYLRAKQLGSTFKRQHIIGDYIADFICLSSRLIIELDGRYHQLPEQQRSDAERTEWLNNYGYRVIRFTNDEVICDIQGTLNKIRKYL